MYRNLGKSQQYDKKKVDSKLIHGKKYLITKKAFNAKESLHCRF